MNRIAVIVPNWNGLDDLPSCIESLTKQTYKDLSIIIVDNGSTDGSVDYLKKITNGNDKIIALYKKKNTGFTGGVNTGIKYTMKHDYDAFALFNNDAVADKEWLAQLAKELNGDRGIVTGMLLHEDGKTIDSTGDWYSTWGLPFPRERDSKKEAAQKSDYVFGASGGASLYDLRMIREIGIFDDPFFAYYEDVDLSFRAQLAGWKVYYTSSAIAYHKQGATSDRIPGFTVKQTFKNLPVLFIKNVPRGLLFSIGIRFFLAYYIILLNAIVKGNAKAALTGWFLSIKLVITHAIKARRAIQKNKKVSTEYINSILWHDLPPNQTGLRKLKSIFYRKEES